MGSRPQLWIYECKTVPLGHELQVCMVPRPHLWIFAHKTACIAAE